LYIRDRKKIINIETGKITLTKKGCSRMDAKE
ncbi:hypothetical protein, partial [Staphylococcus aureus]